MDPDDNHGNHDIIKDYQFKWLIFIVSVEIALYIAVLLMTIYMTHYLLIKESYSKQCHLTLFYVFAYAVITLRIVYFSLKITDYDTHLHQKRAKEIWGYDHVFSLLAMYFKVLLGLTQFTKFSSIAIEIQVLSKCNFLLNPEALAKINKRIRCTHIYSLVLTLVETCFVGWIIHLIWHVIDFRKHSPEYVAAVM